MITNASGNIKSFSSGVSNSDNIGGIAESETPAVNLKNLMFQNAQVYIEIRIHSHFDEGPLKII